MHTEEDLLRKALDLGAKGYVLKHSAMLKIIAAVMAVAAGQPYLSSTLTARLLDRRAATSSPNGDLISHLTPTERRIVRLIAADKSSKEIGAELAIHHRIIEIASAGNWNSKARARCCDSR